LFSTASFCITSSGNHCSKGQIAAGFPPKSLDVNASTWYIGNVMVIVNGIIKIIFNAKEPKSTALFYFKN
jgi:hypothetical protein